RHRLSPLLPRRRLRAAARGRARRPARRHRADQQRGRAQPRRAARRRVVRAARRGGLRAASAHRRLRARGRFHARRRDRRRRCRHTVRTRTRARRPRHPRRPRRRPTMTASVSVKLPAMDKQTPALTQPPPEAGPEGLGQESVTPEAAPAGGGQDASPPPAAPPAPPPKGGGGRLALTLSVLALIGVGVVGWQVYTLRAG